MSILFTLLKLIGTLICSGVVMLAIVSYEDIFFGNHKHFEKVKEYKECPECEGLGVIYNESIVNNGTSGYSWEMWTCEKCNGNGYIVKEEYKLIPDKFDWAGFFVVTGFFIPAVIGLIYLIK